MTGIEHVTYDHYDQRARALRAEAFHHALRRIARFVLREKQGPRPAARPQSILLRSA